MSLESRRKIQQYFNNQNKEIEVDAKEFLECYMDRIYSGETRYLINQLRKREERAWEDTKINYGNLKKSMNP